MLHFTPFHNVSIYVKLPQKLVMYWLVPAFGPKFWEMAGTDKWSLDQYRLIGGYILIWWEQSIPTYCNQTPLNL